MQRLVVHGVIDAQIRVLNEGWGLPSTQERLQLSLPNRVVAWVREVSIQSGETVWMFARTVIPQQTLSGKEKILQRLKNRSLGSVLFNYPDLQRSEFHYFVKEDLPARQSVFCFGGKSLLLTEVFFPAIGEL